MNTSIRNYVQSLISASMKVGIFPGQPLSKITPKLNKILCLEKNTLTIGTLSEKASKAEFSCKKMPRLPFTKIPANPLLQHKIKTGEYVAANPEKSLTDVRYIPSSLEASITAVELALTKEQLQDPIIPLNTRIQNLYEHTQSMSEKDVALLHSGSHEVFIHKLKNNKWQVHQIQAKSLKEEDWFKHLFIHQGQAHMLVVSSFYDMRTNTPQKTIAPFTYFGNLSWAKEDASQ